MQMPLAHGQVYVALSRCKSLQGLVLSSPLRRESIISDDTIDEFTRNAGEMTPDKHKLALLRQHYFYELLCEQFDFHPIEQHFLRLLRLLDSIQSCWNDIKQLPICIKRR